MESRTTRSIVATFELCNTEIDEDRLAVIEMALAEYPDGVIMMALKRCLQEVTGQMSVGQIISRIPKAPDERPGPDEALAMIPRHESQSVVWTREMRDAFGLVRHMLEAEPIAAGLAFKQHYKRLCDEAKMRNEPVDWEYSPGTYAAGRTTVLKEAIKKGRLTEKQVRGLDPLALEAPGKRELPAHDSTRRSGPEEIKPYIEMLKKKIGFKS